MTVHGRTLRQGYNGSAKWEWIGRVKEVLTIPVIANEIFFLCSGGEVSGADWC